MDAVQSLEVQPLPVGRVDAVDVADAGSEEIDAQIGDLCALCGVSDLTVAHNAVLDAADGTDLGLDAHALGVCQSDQLRGLGDILLDGVVAAVEHDGGEASLNAGLAALVGAVIQMQSDRNGDAHRIDHCVHHCGDGLEAGHVLAGTLGDAQNDGTLHLLAGGQDSLGPLQIVDVELRHTVVAVAGFDEHFGCIYQHIIYLQNLSGSLRTHTALRVWFNEVATLVYPKQRAKSIH